MLLLRNLFGFERKLVLGFKYIRFKSSIRNMSEGASEKDVLNIRSCKLAEILDCSQGTARLMILKNKSILTMPYEELVTNAVFCKKHLKWGDIIEFSLISLNSSLLHHRYFSLVELGCVNISAKEIIQYGKLLNMRPKELHGQNINIQHEESLAYFDIYPQVYQFLKNDEVNSKILKLYESDSKLWEIRQVIIMEFLSAKLNCSAFKVQQMLHRYPPLKQQSVLITTRLFEVLYKEFKLPSSKIFQAPSILSLHHEAVMSLLLKMPTMLGLKITEIAHKFPLFLRQSPEKLLQVEQVLKDFNISDQQLLCCPRVTAFTPQTIKQRLEYICNSTDLALLKPYQKFLWLVHHFNNLQIRLQTLKTANKPFSISMFMVSSETFDNYITIGAKCRTHIKEVCDYLSNVLNSCPLEILAKLQEFPGLHSSSVKNCSSVVEYLLNEGVSKKQIFNGLGVINYDVDIVKVFFQDLKQNPTYQPFAEWAEHYNLIQLLIYAIEVDSGYKGCKVYAARMKSDELVAYSHL